MDKVGLRELRQQASELLRRVEEGEELTITVSGRPSARLVPVAPRQWRRLEDVSSLFEGPEDPELRADLERFDDILRIPR